MSLSSRYHPWRALRQLSHAVVVYWCHLPDGQLGASDGGRIWLDPRQRQAQRRCSLAHELEHVARGHTACVDAAAERDVREAVARRLIPLEELADALLWSSIEADLADELWVDVATVRDRLAFLDEYETEYLEKAIRAREAWA